MDRDRTLAFGRILACAVAAGLPDTSAADTAGLVFAPEDGLDIRFVDRPRAWCRVDVAATAGRPWCRAMPSTAGE